MKEERFLLQELHVAALAAGGSSGFLNVFEKLSKIFFARGLHSGESYANPRGSPVSDYAVQCQALNAQTFPLATQRPISTLAPPAM